MRGSRLLYIASLCAIGISTAVMMIRPLILMYVLDTVLVPQATNETSRLPAWLIQVLSLPDSLTRVVKTTRNELIWGAAIFLLCTAIGGFFMFLKGIFSAKAAERSARKMKNQLYDHLQLMSYDYHVRGETGDIIQRCTSDVETVRLFLANQFTEIGRAVALVIVNTTIMLSLSPRLTVIAVLLIPGIFLFSFFFFKRVRKKFKETDEAEGALSNVIQENLTGIRVVRAFARQDFELEKYDVRNVAYRDRLYELLRILAAYWSLSDWMCLMQLTLLVIVGGIWAVQGAITIGMFLAFFSYVERLLWPIRQMGRILTDMGKMFVARDRIREILEVEDEYQHDGTLTPEIQGTVEYRGVSFSYGEQGQTLTDIDLIVRAGETIAILGPTGSGKSTMMHLLARLYEPDSGQILIDGIPIETILKRHVRDNVGLVLQEPFLFNKSIRENISLARKEAQEHEVIATAMSASMHHVIEKFEQGYDTEVGEGGVTLSGGQKQRIAIARILLKSPPILIFDDSLSAVDTITDETIRRSLREREYQATTFIISHRITTLAEADRIVVLEQGRIVDVGTHEELINRPGLYRRIWEIQSSDYEDDAEVKASLQEGA